MRPGPGPVRAGQRAANAEHARRAAAPGGRQAAMQRKASAGRRPPEPRAAAPESVGAARVSAQRERRSAAAPASTSKPIHATADLRQALPAQCQVQRGRLPVRRRRVRGGRRDSAARQDRSGNLSAARGATNPDTCEPAGTTALCPPGTLPCEGNTVPPAARLAPSATSAPGRVCSRGAGPRPSVSRGVQSDSGSSGVVRRALSPVVLLVRNDAFEGSVRQATLAVTGACQWATGRVVQGVARPCHLRKDFSSISGAYPRRERNALLLLFRNGYSIGSAICRRPISVRTCPQPRCSGLHLAEPQPARTLFERGRALCFTIIVCPAAPRSGFPPLPLAWWWPAATAGLPPRRRRWSRKTPTRLASRRWAATTRGGSVNRRACRMRPNASAYTLIETNANEDTAKQIADLDSLIAQGVDILIFPPRESQALAPSVMKAQGGRHPRHPHRPRCGSQHRQAGRGLRDLHWV